MIEKFADLGFEVDDKLEQITQKVEDKLGIKVLEMQEALGNYTRDKAEELSQQFVNICPLGNYEKMLEDNDSMAEFLKTEASKAEHWKLHYIQPSDANPALIQFAFVCDAVDEGDTFKGFVFVSKSGKIRHAFAQGE
jgi:hypothetical protein